MINESSTKLRAYTAVRARFPNIPPAIVAAFVGDIARTGRLTMARDGRVVVADDIESTTEQ